MKECSRPSGRDCPEASVQDDPFVSRQGEVLRALGHPIRLQIIQHLRDGERCVCEFEGLLGLRQPNISQHLAILRAANLVNTRRDGLRVMYSVADPTVLEIIDAAAEVVERQGAVWAAALSRGHGE